MKLRVLWVGKTQQEWVRSGIEEYAGRIRRYTPFELTEVREEKGAMAETARQLECARLEKQLSKTAQLIILDEGGEELTSLAFAAFLGKSRELGTTELAFAIGGAYGFSAGFRARGMKTLALSRMTFTHQMVRVFLLEQIYRGFTILNGEPYHH